MNGLPALRSIYVVGEHLGAGPLGDVFRGQVRATGEPVAVKVLRPGLAQDSDVVARFEQERSTLLSLNHPNVVRTRDLFLESGTLALVTDLVDGPDLRHYLKSRRSLQPELAIAITLQVLAAVQAAHEAGIVHRNLKPENVLLEAEGGKHPNVKVTDCGISRIVYSSAVTHNTGPIGTPAYMAPELGAQEDVTSAVDIYSAGVICYELLAGRTPFAGGDPIAEFSVDARPARPGGVPESLWIVIEHMLSKRPADRPSASQAADELVASRRFLAPAPSSNDNPVYEFVEPSPVATGEAEFSHTRAADIEPRSPTVLAPIRAEASEALPVDNVAAGPTSRRPIRIAVVLIVTALAVGASWFAVSSSSSKSSQAATAVSTRASAYKLPVLGYSNAVSVAETWTETAGNSNVLNSAITIVNSGHAKVVYTEDIVIPKSLSSSVRNIRFTTKPNSIVSSDPIVRYCLALAPRSPVRLTYRVSVHATGDQTSHWSKWADDWETAVRADARKRTGKPCNGATTKISVPTFNSSHAGAVLQTRGLASAPDRAKSSSGAQAAAPPNGTPGSQGQPGSGGVLPTGVTPPKKTDPPSDSAASPVVPPTALRTPPPTVLRPPVPPPTPGPVTPHYATPTITSLTITRTPPCTSAAAGEPPYPFCFTSFSYSVGPSDVQITHIEWWTNPAANPLGASALGSSEGCSGSPCLMADYAPSQKSVSPLGDFTESNLEPGYVDQNSGQQSCLWVTLIYADGQQTSSPQRCFIWP